MPQVHCRTSLDGPRRLEVFPTNLPVLPQIGNKIQSTTVHNGNFRLTMKVVDITWKYCNLLHEWYAEIELGDDWPQPRSIKEFYEWYAPLVGRPVSSFI